MSILLTSDFLHFSINSDGSSWNIKPRNERAMPIESRGVKVEYLLAGKKKQSTVRWQNARNQTSRSEVSPVGMLDRIDIVQGPDDNGLEFSLTFAIVKSNPLFLWKCSIRNVGNEPVQILRITLLDIGGQTHPFPKLENPAFFSNGWGSWNHTGVYGISNPFRRSLLSFFSAPMRVNAGTPQIRLQGRFVSDMFGVLGDRESRQGILVGFLSQEQHFGSLELDLRPTLKRFRLWANGDAARLDSGAEIETDWACIQYLDVDNCDPLGPYIEAVAQQAGINTQRFQMPIPTGWCSWYHFFSKVNAEDIRSNLEAAGRIREEVPLSIIQIDDGFEAQVGDWFDFSARFPQGVAPLAQEILGEGFMPGLWLAPFIVDRRSRLARRHPDWLLRGRFNLPVNAGFLWNNFTTALDLTHPQALAYAQQVVKTAAHDWGFPYLKLDFLYAGALPGRRYNPRLTRAQALRRGLQTLRSAVGDQTFLLGCGCPLGSAIGLVDAMRIGADVDARWKPAVLGVNIPPLHSEPDTPAARNAIQNSLTCAALHRRWWLNDPDCLLLRDTTQLTLDEVYALATVIALTGGLFFLSDDLPELSPARLSIAQALLPPIGMRPQVVDWFDAGMPQRVCLDLDNAGDRWQLLALFNWQDTAQKTNFCLQDFGLSAGDGSWIREFWQGETSRLPKDARHSVLIPIHGVRVFAIRPIDRLRPVYLGSDLHISQGLEVEHRLWQADDGLLELELHRPGRASGTIELSLPREPISAALNDQAIDWLATEQGNFRFQVRFEQQARLRVIC